MNRPTLKAVVIPLVSLVLLIVVGFFVYNRVIRQRVATGQPESKYAVEALGNDKLPDRFPLDLPIPKDASITKNERLTAPDGRSQEVRAYTVTRALPTERDAYAAYFAKNDWKLQDKKDLGTYAAFLADRNGVSVQVSMNGEGTTMTSVIITVTLAPSTITK